jgi:putative transposase
MPNYRRAAVPGGTYFFTLTSYQRRNILCNDEVRIALRDSIRTTQAKHPFTIDAWVLMPDHLHCIWILPPGDDGYSIRWSMIKRLVTQRVGFTGGAPYVSASREKRREGHCWQRRFWEHWVRDENDLNRCRNYLHWNPVKHGHVSRVADWPYSTFHRFVREGMYTEDWGGQGIDDGGSFGE